MDVIVSGLICLDIIPLFEGPANLIPGRVTEIGPAGLATGGAVANTGLALHRLGIATGLMGKVGDDLFGRAILQIVEKIDPDLLQGMLVAPGETSSYSIVISPPGTDRIFFHCPGASHSFGAADVNYDLVAGSRVFHLGYPPYMRHLYMDGGGELVDLFRRVKGLGVTTSLDMALPDPSGASGQVDWPAVLARVLPYVDLLLPSAEELCFMLDRPRYNRLAQEELSPDEIRHLAERCLAWGARVVMVKCGERGLYLRTSNASQLRRMGRAAPPQEQNWALRELWSPCFKPKQLIGTTGSGDATIAGFLAALLHGETIEQAANTACAVGACNVEAADAISGLLTWDETHQRMQAGWNRLAVDLPAPAWNQHPGGLWSGPSDHSSG